MGKYPFITFSKNVMFCPAHARQKPWANSSNRTTGFQVTIPVLLVLLWPLKSMPPLLPTSRWGPAPCHLAVWRQLQLNHLYLETTGRGSSRAVTRPGKIIYLQSLACRLRKDLGEKEKSGSQIPKHSSRQSQKQELHTQEKRLSAHSTLPHGVCKPSRGDPSAQGTVVQQVAGSGSH